MSEHSFINYNLTRLVDEEMRRRADEFYELMSQRRSVRHFSSEEVPRELIERAIETASTAPSGAHRQPWRFVAIGNAEIKRQIRVAAEEEERISYESGRMPQEWLDALAPFGTNWEKPFLEVAPWIVVVFEEMYGTNTDGSQRKYYYVKESVGMACGLFIAALHNMGLAALTHTPSPMAFLSRILKRPPNEKPYVLIPIGYPADDARVPLLKRKMMDDIATWL
jgi:iodotyrosine deiodinase